MALTDDALQPARGSNSRVCPYSTGRAPGTQESRAPDTRTQESKAPDTQESRGPDAFPYHSRAPGSHAQENSAYNADDTTCPSTSDKAFTDTPAQESSFPDAEGTTCPFRATPAVVTPTPKPAAHGDLQSSCLSSSHSDGPPQVTQSKAAGKCPFHFEPSTSSPLLSSALPQPAPAPAAAEVEHELPGMSAMTDEALREYEQAFAVDPDEAMLRAYGALLADKVAEACGQADDSSKSDAEGRQGREFECTAAQPSTPPPGCTPKQPTLPAHGLAPSRLAHASPLVQRYESETRASKAPQASSHATCAQIAEADSAAAATQTNNMTNRSSGLHAVTAHSKAAVMAAFACQGVHDACQHSMNRVSACRDFLQQQPLRWHLLMTACLGLQLVMMLYFSLVHQRYAPWTAGEATGNPPPSLLRLYWPKIAMSH